MSVLIGPTNTVVIVEPTNRYLITRQNPLEIKLMYKGLRGLSFILIKKGINARGIILVSSIIMRSSGGGGGAPHSRQF